MGEGGEEAFRFQCRGDFDISIIAAALEALM
jgi:hypothetical protein